MSIVITGATGHLGRLVVSALADQDVLALGRDQARLDALSVPTRRVAYEDLDGLTDAFRGADAVLFISGSEVGQRLPQHRNVVDAAVRASVGRLVYTSAPKADTTRLLLAGEHLATENMILESGLPYTFLRNSWYVENYTAALQSTVENGVLLGAAGEGRVSAAARADYAAAAAATLTGTGHANKIYELGGDDAFTLAELAAEIGRRAGRPVEYRNLPQAEYAAALVSFGVPQPAAEIFADADRAIEAGELHVETGDLHRLIGRPTTPWQDVIAEAVKTL